MRKFSALITSIALGSAAAITVPASAQDAAATTETGVTLNIGATAHDSAGKEIGPITGIDGANAIITVGDKAVALPKTSFMQTDKGLAITLSLEQLNTWLDQQAAANAAALDGALIPGTDVRSAKGVAVVGKIKLVEAGHVVLDTADGDIRLPKKAFFLSQQGLATSFTAEQFAAAVAEAKAANGANSASADNDAATGDSTERQAN